MRRTATGRAIVLAAALAAAAALAPRAQSGQEGGQPLDEESWSLFQKVFGMVLRDYVEPKTPADVMAGALQGAAASAGPECAYVPPDEAAAYRAAAEGGAVLPLYVTKESDFARVLALFPGQDAAIKPGDSLRFIGTRSTYDMTYPQVLEALRGPEGEKVRCIFLKEEAWQSYEVTLSRQMPAAPRWVALGQGSGCLVLPCLEPACPAEVEAELRSGKGPVLIDLRGCASDDARAALRWAGILLGSGEGPARKGNRGTVRDPLSGPGLLAGRPLRALVDGTTARGGEVLAAALASAGATLVGAPTFGFAPYARDLPLENGGILRLNTAYFLAPDGRPINGHGITPPIALAPSEGQKPAELYRLALQARPTPEKGTADGR